MEEQDEEAIQVQNDNILIACDRERWEREKQILVESNRWCMEEISLRERKLNEISIEMIKIESKMQQELISLSDEKETLSQNISRLNESMVEKEEALSQLREKLQQMIEERATYLNEADAELRVRESLANVYKASLDAANNEISMMKETEEQLRSELKQSETAFADLNAELMVVNANREKECLDKDKTIHSLKEEIDLANSIIKTSARTHHHNVSAFSSVAASAANRIGEVTTSSLLYVDYGRIKEELDRTIKQKKQLEEYVRELLAEIEIKAPQFVHQAEQCKYLAEEVSQLRLKSEILSDERERLQNSKDAATRELKYASADLDRYMAENKQLSLQISQLLFGIEKRASNNRSNASLREEQHFFNNIEELQKQNIDLTAKLRCLESELQESRAAQTSFQQSDQHLMKLESSVQDLIAERDKFKSHCEELEDKVKNAEEKRLSLEQTQSDLTQWKARAEFIQEKLNCFNQEKQQVENSLNKRIDQQLELIGQHRVTNGRLESTLEFQKNNQQLLNKRMLQLESDLEKANESAMKSAIKVELQQEKIEELAGQLLHHQKQTAMTEKAAVEESSMAVELDELRKQSDAQKKQINQLLSVNEELGCAVDIAEKKAHQLEQQINELLEALKSEDIARSNAAAVENSFAELVKKSEVEKRDILGRLLAASEEIEQLKLTVEKNGDLLKQTKTLAIKFRNNNTDLERENKLLKEEIERLNKDVTLCSSTKPGDIRQLLQERIQEALKITGEKKDLTIKLGELLKEKDVLTDKLCKLNTDLEEANANCTHLDTITAAFEESQKQIETLQEALDKKDCELTELRKVLDSNFLSVGPVELHVSQKRTLKVPEDMPIVENVTKDVPIDMSASKRIKTSEENLMTLPESNLELLASDEGYTIVSSLAEEIVCKRGTVPTSHEKEQNCVETLQGSHEIIPIKIHEEDQTESLIISEEMPTVEDEDKDAPDDNYFDDCSGNDNSYASTCFAKVFL